MVADGHSSEERGTIVTIANRKDRVCLKQAVRFTKSY